jgi:CHAT domain-containing protein/Tfp pilus assembly protein PilF
MREINQNRKSFRSGVAARCVGVVIWLVLLSVMPTAATSQQSAELVAGQPIGREMRGGEEHTYQLRLSAGEYARVVVEQKGIDVVVALFGAEGKPLVDVDNNLSGTRGLETVSLVADVSGVYRVVVRSLQEDASAGRYEARLDDLRMATGVDRKRVVAERVYFAGVKLHAERTGDSRRKAIERYTEALPLMRDAGDRRGEAMTLTNLGALHNINGEQQKARDHLDQALAVWRAVGDRHLEAITLTLIGSVYYALGEPQKALESHGLALPVMRAVGDQSGEARTFTQIGTVYRFIGEPQKALDYYTQALPVWRVLGDRRNEATVLNNMGTVYNLLGETQKALNYFEQALPLARATKDPRLISATLTNIGNIYNLLGNPRNALAHLDQALAITQANNDRRTEAGVLTHTGTAYSLLKERSKAVEYFERALQLRTAVSDRQGEAITLNHFGRAFDLWREPRKALEYYEKALPIWRAVGDRNGEVAALFGTARALSEVDDLSGASARSEEALAIISTLRTKVASRDLRASYFASLQDLYKLHIDLLMRLHRREPAKGFDVAALKTYEQARARSMMDLLAEGSADISQGVDPALLARERSLRQMLNAEADRQMRLFAGQHTEETASAQRRKIDELLTQLRAVEAELKANSPRYAALTQPAPLDLKEIQTAVTDDATLLLEYSLGEERSYLWAVTATSFSSYELPPRDVIETAARRCYELLTARNQFVKFETADEKRERVRQADAEYPQAALALSQMLLGPVAAQLARKRLLVVPDGTLEYLPFAALAVPGKTATAHPQDARRVLQVARRVSEGPRSARAGAVFVPLIVEHEVTSIPSASTLAVLRRELYGRAPAEKVVAVFADPVFDKDDERVTRDSPSSDAGVRRVAPVMRATELRSVLNAEEVAQSADGPRALTRLPYTRQEAEAILALAPPTARKAALGFEANRAAVMSDDLSEFRIIHFATHSYLDSEHPELSAIALSMLDRQGRPQEGYLRAHEVFNLKLDAELVVLSGCRTGLGKEVKGEGLYGMTRGFMYAGSKRVVVSLWDVQDLATARLMSDFYRELLGPKRPHAAAALRAAQIATWRERRWQAPYYWAAFVLQGEPK